MVLVIFVTVSGNKVSERRSGLPTDKNLWNGVLEAFLHKNIPDDETYETPRIRAT
jgi:hypothetical protein